MKKFLEVTNSKNMLQIQCPMKLLVHQAKHKPQQQEKTLQDCLQGKTVLGKGDERLDIMKKLNSDKVIKETSPACVHSSLTKKTMLITKFGKENSTAETKYINKLLLHTPEHLRFT